MKDDKTKQFVYLDHAAATPLAPEVKRAMEPYWDAEFANPSAIHAGGVYARKAVEEARKRVAKIIHCMPQEVVFVPGGTAGNNLAVLGAARAIACGMLLSNSRELDNKKNGIRHQLKNLDSGLMAGTTTSSHIIVSALEHASVLEPAKQLEREGFAVTYVQPDKNGIVQPEAVKRALRPDTILVSAMYANNEIGTIQPIRETAKVIRAFRKAISSALKAISYPLLHTDACQAANYLDLNVQRLGVDLMTLNGSKIYGPKMTGMLYVRKGIALQPVVYGGGQEHGLWSGTENVPGIVGFVKALEVAQKLKEKESELLTVLRDYFIERLRKRIPGVILNGDAVRRLPNNVHISIAGLEGEVLVVYLDARGIAAAVGSACSSQSTEPSHVLKAIGLPAQQTRSSVRFTLGRNSTKAQCDYVLAQIKNIVQLLS